MIGSLCLGGGGRQGRWDLGSSEDQDQNFIFHSSSFVLFPAFMPTTFLSPLALRLYYEPSLPLQQHAVPAAPALKSSALRKKRKKIKRKKEEEKERAHKCLAAAPRGSSQTLPVAATFHS